MYVTKYVANTQYGQGSIISFAQYLEKEALLQQQLDNNASSKQLSAYLDKQNDKIRTEGHEYFFNGSGALYDSEDVTQAIDCNVKGLKKSEARYYTFSISPSAQEIDHLRRSIADQRQVLTEAGETLPDDYEDQMMRSALKTYAVQCMDSYAQNFNHPQIHTNEDLLWFGMVEKDRYWKSKDSEVQKNTKIDKQIAQLESKQDQQSLDQIEVLKKKYIRECDVRPGGSREILRPMMPKNGDNWHIHVTVSRRDFTNTFNLSPNANSRQSKNHKLNGKAVRVGFNRETQKINCERIFDRMFSHRRLITESYEGAKALRKESSAAFYKQRAADQAARRSEASEYNRFHALGYRDYYDQLIAAEHIDAKQLTALKFHLIGQIRTIKPNMDIEELKEYTLDELQAELGQFSDTQDLSVPKPVERITASIGDRAIQISGLEGYRPISTTRKLLKRGIAVNKAIDRRREVLDRWCKIYTEEWYRENTLFDNVADRQRLDILFAQTEFLEQQFGDSALLQNAETFLVEHEQQLVSEFLQEQWPAWQEDATRHYAQELFGKDGMQIHTAEQFELAAKERLFPMDAKAALEELHKRYETPKQLDALRSLAEVLRPEKIQNIDSFLLERGSLHQAIRQVLAEPSTIHAKEEALLRLAQTNPGLEKALKNLRSTIVKQIEHLYPDLKAGEQQEKIAELLEQLKDLRLQRQTEMATIIDQFISEQLPGYELIVEKQSQLEQLLKEITPDKERLAERLVDVNKEISAQVSPKAQALFEQHSRALFGDNVLLRNEADFNAYVENRFSKEMADNYKRSLQKVYARIDEKRQAIIQNYVRRNLSRKELENARRQQKYINRFIRRKFSPQQIKHKSELFQRRITEACHRHVTPPPEYRVFNSLAQKNVLTKATVKANQVKLLAVSPQQLAIKAAFKLVNILTKGY